MIEIDTYHVGQQVHEPDGGQKIQIDLPDELLFLLGRPGQLAVGLRVFDLMKLSVVLHFDWNLCGLHLWVL